MGEKDERLIKIKSHTFRYQLCHLFRSSNSMYSSVLFYFNHICLMIEKIPRTGRPIFHVLSGDQYKVQRTSKIPSFLSKAPSLFFSSTYRCRKKYGEYSLFQRDFLFDAFSKYMEAS